MATTVPSSPLLLIALLMITLTAAAATHPLNFTLVNNCPYTVWPGIQPNAGHPVLESGGFALPPLTHRSFAAPSAHWSGRMWARTHCSSAGPANHLSCATGDCARRLQCSGAGGSPPATLAQFSIRHGPGAALSSYGVSLVDGFNLPFTITPHGGSGLCPVVGCRENLLASCPAPLQLRANGHGVVGCKSGCEAFGTDELCCRNHYNSPQTCRASTYSMFFKHACPTTFTFAHDTPSLMHECSAPNELKIIFCH